VSGAAVAAAAHRQLEPAITRERDDPGNVAGAGDPEDRRRPAVDPAMEDGPGFVVAGIARRDHPTLKAGKGGDGGGRCDVHRAAPLRVGAWCWARAGGSKKAKI
jgi:hypothetical protein